MTTSATQPPGHLSEVFRFLSSCAPATTQAYETFRSPYYTFNGARPTAAAAVMAPTQTETLPPAQKFSEVRATQQRSVSPLAPRSLSTGAAAAQASGSAAPLPQLLSPPSAAPVMGASNGPSSLPPTSPPPPSKMSPSGAAATAGTPADAVAPFQCTVPSPVMPKPKPKDCVKRADFDSASVGSTELPVEQLPDEELPSPVSRHIGASSPTVAVQNTHPSFRAAGEASKDLSSFSRLALHTVSGAAAGSVDSGERSQSGAPVAASSPTHHVSFSDFGVVCKARSCSIASLAERRSSQLFQNGEALSSFPGARRVSLRRPVFDEDDD